MQNKIVSRKITRSSAPRRRWKTLTGAIAAILATAGLVAITLSGPTPGVAGPTTTCAPRLIIVDLSSAARSPQLSGLGQHVIEQAATSAVVCNDNLSTYGVSGGGELSTILTSDDLGAFTP